MFLLGNPVIVSLSADLRMNTLPTLPCILMAARKAFIPARTDKMRIRFSFFCRQMLGKSDSGRYNNNKKTLTCLNDGRRGVQQVGRGRGEWCGVVKVLHISKPWEELEKFHDPLAFSPRLASHPTMIKNGHRMMTTTTTATLLHLALALAVCAMLMGSEVHGLPYRDLG